MSRIVSILLCVGWLSSIALAVEPTWKAGVAKSVITPKEPIWMAGYGSRTKPAEGALHDLYVRVLALEDAGGRRVHYPIDNYLQERAMWIEYRGIRVINHHRPMSTYLRALLGAGLVLTHFDEPEASPDAPASRARSYARAPWFLVMEWLKPPARGR